MRTLTNNLPEYIRIKDIASAPATKEKTHIYKTGKNKGKSRILRGKPERRGILPVTEKTIWLWVKEDKFPSPFKINGTTLWSKNDVFDFINSKLRPC